MKKAEQIIKELQMHLDNGSLNYEIIEDKIWDLWRHDKDEHDGRWIKLFKKISSGLKPLSSSIKSEMEDSHHWTPTEDAIDSECRSCGLDWMSFHQIPRYCAKD